MNTLPLDKTDAAAEAPGTTGDLAQARGVKNNRKLDEAGGATQVGGGREVGLPVAHGAPHRMGGALDISSRVKQWVKEQQEHSTLNARNTASHTVAEESTTPAAGLAAQRAPTNADTSNALPSQLPPRSISSLIKNGLRKAKEWVQFAQEDAPWTRLPLDSMQPSSGTVESQRNAVMARVTEANEILERKEERIHRRHLCGKVDDAEMKRLEYVALLRYTAHTFTMDIDCGGRWMDTNSVYRALARRIGYPPVRFVSIADNKGFRFAAGSFRMAWELQLTPLYVEQARSVVYLPMHIRACLGSVFWTEHPTITNEGIRHGLAQHTDKFVGIVHAESINKTVHIGANIDQLKVGTVVVLSRRFNACILDIEYGGECVTLRNIHACTRCAVYWHSNEACPRKQVAAAPDDLGTISLERKRRRGRRGGVKRRRKMPPNTGTDANQDKGQD